MGRTWQQVSRRGADVGQVPAANTPPPGSAGVVIVASSAVVVAASVIAAGVGAAAPWVFEVLAATGVLVGLGVAFGLADRGPSARPRGRGSARRRRTREALVTPELSASLEEQLRALDPVEHRRLDLGSPWPTVVVGPTGVTVVAVADRVGPGAVARLRDVLLEVRRLAVTQVGERPIAVRALLVVPDHEVPAAEQGDVRAVAVADVAGVVARGPIVPMTTVTTVFAQLSGQLAPDLRADAV